MPGGSAAVTPVCNHPVAVSIPVINGADQVNNASKRTAMTTANATNPYTRCVRMPSIRLVHLRVSSRDTVRMSATTVSIQ